MPRKKPKYPILNDVTGFRRRLGRWWGERDGSYLQVGNSVRQNDGTPIRGGWLQVYTKHKHEIWDYFNVRDNTLGENCKAAV